MSNSKGMQLGAMLAAILFVSMALVSAVSAESPTLVSDLSGNNGVSVNKALEHARVYMLRAVLTEMSRDMLDSYEF